MSDTASIRRIATEEAFATPEQIAAIRALAGSGSTDPDLEFWRGLIGDTPYAATMLPALLDLDDRRLAAMDGSGVDVHLLSLTSPGVQMLGADTAAGVAETANDRLAEAIARHPTRFAGLAAIAPQDPSRAVKELDRAIGRLGLNGVIINSHTEGLYLDEPKFWPILEAAAALEAPIYIHPRMPPLAMIEPYRAHRLHTVIWGYQAETGLHGMRLIMSGVFDRFPKLKIVLGHMGEGIPYWFWRMDHMVGMMRRNAGAPPARLPSEVFKDHFLITTSGVNHHPVLKYGIEVVGPDNIMFAIDYPYQDTADSVNFLDTAPISAADRAKIYHGNAERVFRIGR